MKDSIMILSPKKENIHDFKKHEIQELYYFLKLIDGNYRNSLYIKCPHGYEYMLTADYNARPVLFPVEKFYELTGELPQKDELISSMSNDTFYFLYRQWLIWNTESNDACGICGMYNEQTKK